MHAQAGAGRAQTASWGSGGHGSAWCLSFPWGFLQTMLAFARTLKREQLVQKHGPGRYWNKTSTQGKCAESSPRSLQRQWVFIKALVYLQAVQFGAAWHPSHPSAGTSTGHVPITRSTTSLGPICASLLPAPPGCAVLAVSSFETFQLSTIIYSLWANLTLTLPKQACKQGKVTDTLGYP